MTDGPLDEAVKQIVKAHNAYIEKHLRLVPVGSTVCIHELAFESSFDMVNDLAVYKCHLKSHVVHPQYPCNSPVRKTQYVKDKEL